MTASTPPVAIIMGSRSDWPTMKLAAERLDQLGVAWEAKVVSAHRTPQRLYDFATTAREKGFKVVIAGAGGAAHLPGMLAAKTIVPVLGVPVSPPGWWLGRGTGLGSYSGGGSVPAVVSGQPGIAVSPAGVTSIVPEWSRRNT